MKVILSRKGFDSQCGKQANPILPDGTLLSFPIPDKDDNLTFSDVKWNGQSYIDIIRSLKPRTELEDESHCHLDPDLRKESITRKNGWQPAFGQTGSSLTELRNHNIKVGDLFLFFGWFKETEYRNGRLQYKYKARDLHVIYGYMQIGDIIESYNKVPDWLKYHAHSNYQKYESAWNRNMNAIYLPSDKLSIDPNYPGCGTFQFDRQFVLTKDGYSRSRWEFPDSMRGIPISHNPNGWKDNYFQSAARGQEFIIAGVPAVMKWVRSLFN